MATLGDIEVATRRLADHHELLTLRVENLHNQIEELKRAHLPAIKETAANTANIKAELAALIDESRSLFAKPKSIIISGIRVGLKKGTGMVEFEDEALVIKRIKKLMSAELHETYIKTTEKLRKKPLEDLDASMLKKLGVKIEGNGEVVLIKMVASDVDKIVNAMLKGAEDGPDEIEEAA